MKLRSVLGFVWVVVAACSDGGGASGSEITIEKVSGDSQAIALSTASAPLVVRVRDADGQPLVGERVDFAVLTGTGGLLALADTTDGDGLASTGYTGSGSAGLRRIGARRATVDTAQVIFALNVGPGLPSTLLATGGNEQAANAGAALAVPLATRVSDGFGNTIPGVTVHWSIQNGAGSLSVDSSLTDGNGIATASRTLGPGAGGQVVLATVAGLTDTLRFHATAKKPMTVLAGGNNVADQCSSDLWIHGNYAYTGTWGNCGGLGSHLLIVWDVTSGVAAADTVSVGLGTVSDDEVSEDGTLLLATSESGGAGANGLYLYSLVDPAHPVQIGFEGVARGLHTGTFATIGGQRYVFAARNPHTDAVPDHAALMVFRIQPDSADKIVPVAAVVQPETYGIHDQFIRDGLAFVSDWNAGMRIYDVGDGRLGGSPAAPQLISSIVTAANGAGCNCVHNSWWYHDADGGKRYLFIGQEGPSDFTSASGDIHVVDVSDLAAPEEVAFFHLAGAGVHNFWMDEARGILYAAYYNGGVVALDVTGTLSGNLATREIARITPGGPGNTFTWGVMLAEGALYASDMFSGFWKLSVP